MSGLILVLTVTRNFECLEPHTRSFRFNSAGGSIGRSNSNKWTLPDPNRFVSSQHGLISFEAGNFYLTDTSSNGTFINQTSQPLGKGKKQILNAGDRILMGTYCLEVSLVETTTQPSQPMASPALEDVHPEPLDLNDPSNLDPLNLISPQVENKEFSAQDHGYKADVNHSPAMHDFFQPTTIAAESLVGSSSSSQNEDSWEDDIPENWHETGFIKALDINAYSPVATSTSNKLEDSSDHQSSNSALNLNDPNELSNNSSNEDLTENSSPQTQENWQQLKSTVLTGMIELLKSRTSIKSELNIANTCLMSAQNNPLKFSSTAEEADHWLFNNENNGFLSPVDAFEQAFSDLESHQVALLIGIRSGINCLLTLLDPENFEVEQKKHEKKNLLSKLKNSPQFWDLYKQHFLSVTDSSDEAFNKMFGSAFSQAYEAHMKNINPGDSNS